MDSSHDLNLVVLRGVLARDAQERTVLSGDRIVSYEITTRIDGVSVTVPVVLVDGPPLAAGVEVVVSGQVRRRFFRSGGTTQSRTEVSASSLTRASARKGVERVMESARSALGA